MQEENREKPLKPSRRSASRSKYVSPNQNVLPGFETPYENQLTVENRWVKLSSLIPWDSLVSSYDRLFSSKEGRQPINGRIVIGAVIIKHICNFTDEETVLHLRENMFMQYFLGYSSFTNELPFDASFFVGIRKRLDMNMIDELTKSILQHNKILPTLPNNEEDINQNNDGDKEDNTSKLEENTNEITASTDITTTTPENQEAFNVNKQTHNGKLLMDATVSPQDITYPTDLKLLDASRRKSEELIDKLHQRDIGEKSKPRTYREEARKHYLNIAKKKQPSFKDLYKAIGGQLRYLNRNIKIIESLLATYADQVLPLKKKDFAYIKTIKLVLAQQSEMHAKGFKRIENRIVNIHQPHVRPMVRGKAGKKVEFGSKMHISLVNGFTFIDKLSWDSFNEGQCLKDSVEAYKSKFGFYPKEVLADTIYANRENRQYLKDLGIILQAKSLGRPPKNQALSNQIRPGERNPVEGKFGQAKRAYGLERVRAKLKETSESWISSIVMVLNLVKLMRIVSSRLRNFVTKILNIYYNLILKTA
jgi:transposase, IS5 family